MANEMPLLKAQSRAAAGKSEARRLRRQGLVPAVAYGKGLPTSNDDGLPALRFYTLVTTPHAIRAPLLPEGSVRWSSGSACSTMALPSASSREFEPGESVTRDVMAVNLVRPKESTVRASRSPACGPSGANRPWCLPAGLKCPPALANAPFASQAPTV